MTKIFLWEEKPQQKSAGLFSCRELGIAYDYGILTKITVSYDYAHGYGYEKRLFVSWNHLSGFCYQSHGYRLGFTYDYGFLTKLRIIP